MTAAIRNTKKENITSPAPNWILLLITPTITPESASHPDKVATFTPRYFLSLNLKKTRKVKSTKAIKKLVAINKKSLSIDISLAFSNI